MAQVLMMSLSFSFFLASSSKRLELCYRSALGERLGFPWKSPLTNQDLDLHEFVKGVLKQLNVSKGKKHLTCEAVYNNRKQHRYLDLCILHLLPLANYENANIGRNRVRSHQNAGNSS
jgi:hypothetical protein